MLRRAVLMVSLLMLSVGAVWGGSIPAARAGDREAEIDFLLAGLRNTGFATGPWKARILPKVQQLLEFHHPRADRGLLRELADTDQKLLVVEQVVIATLIDPEHRLLEGVVARLLRERGSDFDHRFDRPLLIYSDQAMVTRLGELALDTDRRLSLRVEATRMLGRTGRPEALEPLLAIWARPETELQGVARVSFNQVLPGGFKTREAAAEHEALRRRNQTPFAESLRQIIAGGAGANGSPGTSRPDGDAYRTLALALVDHVPLEMLPGHYLESRDPVVRAEGARRIAAYPFDEIQGPHARSEARKTAARACVAALVRETDPVVKAALIEPLTKLVVPLQQGAMDDAGVKAVLRCARAPEPELRDLKLKAVSLLGALRDAQALQPLQDEYDAMGEADYEVRIAILDAIFSVARRSVTGWLVRRLETERDDSVAQSIIFHLGTTDDRAVIGPLNRIRKTHGTARVRLKAIHALSALWTSRKYEEAREGLLEGLGDSSKGVRLACAGALRHPSAEAATNRGTIERLKVVLTGDSEDVRARAALSILELDEDHAAANLVNGFGEAAIWELYRDWLVERSLDTGDPVQGLADARMLLAHKDPATRKRGEELLTALAVARNDRPERLWEGSPDVEGGVPERGVVREALARVHIAQENWATVVERADELLAAARDRDPVVRWKLLKSRGLRGRGSPTDLREVRAILQPLRLGDRTGPADQRVRVLVELASVLSAQGDPAFATTVLREAAAVQDVSPELRRELEVQLVAAETDEETERVRVLELVDAAVDPATGRLVPGAAHDELKALRGRVAVHVLGALSGSTGRSTGRSTGGSTGLARQFQLLWAGSLVLGKSVSGLPRQLAPDATTEDLATVRTSVMGELRRIVEEERSR